MNRPRMQPFKRQLAEAFKEHELKDQPMVKSWRVAKPDCSFYAFTVTWSYGVLAMAGDLGELTITHYHAMPTWEDAVCWLHQSDFGYILSKSNARKEFNRDASIQAMVAICDDDQRWDSNAPMWANVFKAQGWRLDIEQPNHRNKAHQASLIAAMRDDLNQHDLYEMASSSDDYFVRETYTTRHRWQFEALQLWARMVIESGTIQTKEVAA